MGMSKGIMIFLLLMALAAIVTPAYASLSPISFGFPAWAQNSQSTVLHQADVNQFDFGTANVNVPVASESDICGQTVTTTDFLQNSIFSSYSYPAVGIGASGLPGFWF
jgi:hypothetical protein